MKIVLVAIIASLSACGADPEFRPDAAPEAPDAAVTRPDASPPVAWRGCPPMGSLPDSRTITINTGDPIPPALINELQDNIVGARRKAWRRTFVPIFVTSGATFGYAANPANAAFPPVRVSAGSGTEYLAVPFDEGDTITGFAFEGYGDGAVDVTFDVVYASSMHVAFATLSAGGFVVVNMPASWNTYTLTPFTPQLLAAGSFLAVKLNPNAANFCLQELQATFVR